MTGPGGSNSLVVTHDAGKGRQKGLRGTPLGRLCRDSRASEGRVCAGHLCPVKVTGVPEKVTAPAAPWEPMPGAGARDPMTNPRQEPQPGVFEKGVLPR